MALNPTGDRQDVRVYRTPNTADALFYELRPAAGKERGTVPAYGDAHEDATNRSGFKLCFIEPAKEDGLKEKWWYVEDLTSQETWNGDLSYPYAGSPLYPRVTRKYILPRATGVIPLQLGTTDPGGTLQSGAEYLRPDGTSRYLRPGGVDTYNRPGIGPAILVAQSTRFLEGVIGSLYVEVTRVFDVISGTDDLSPGSGETQKDNGYTISYPFGGHEYIQLVWTITLPRLIAQGLTAAAGGTRPDTMTPCPISGYTNLLMVKEEIIASSEENQTSKVVRTFRGNRSGDAFPSVETPIASEKRYPGNFPPEKFLANIIERQVVQDATFNADTLVDSVGGEFTLVSINYEPESTLTGKRTRTYITPVLKTLRGEQWDPVLETNVPYTVEALPWENGTIYRENDSGVTETVTVTGARNLTAVAGTELTIAPYNAKWAIVTKETPLPTTVTLATAVFPSPAITRHGTYPYAWPAVLDAASAVYSEYTNASGSTDFFINWRMSKDAWQGHCKARFQTAYCTTNPLGTGALATQLPTDHLAPSEMRLSWPIRRFNIPECLHPRLPSDEALVLQETVGTVTFSTFFPASTLNNAAQTDWPDSLCIIFDVKPHKGGFVVKRVDVYKPY